VKRTAEKIKGSGGYHSAVRFTDYQSARSYPSSKLLGYYHPSALRTNKSTYWAKPLTPKSEPNSNFPLLVFLCNRSIAAGISSPLSECFSACITKPTHSALAQLLNKMLVASPWPGAIQWTWASAQTFDLSWGI
jgi:hypothetical protein